MSNPKEDAVIAFLDYFHSSKLDIAGVRAALADDARYQPVVPLSRPVEGADRICGELERQYQIYADCQCNMLNIATVGNTVFTERVDRCRQLSDGRETVVHVVGVFDVDANNKITWWREYWDALDIAGQMGLTGEQMRAVMDTAVPA